MIDLRERFTEWYYHKGYRMRYADEVGELVFSCPWWIRPLVYIFFSPSVYYHESGKKFAEDFKRGVKGE